MDKIQQYRQIVRQVLAEQAHPYVMRRASEALARRY
jgi:hypothetical protein